MNSLRHWLFLPSLFVAAVVIQFNGALAQENDEFEDVWRLVEDDEPDEAIRLLDEMLAANPVDNDRHEWIVSTKIDILWQFDRINEIEPLVRSELRRVDQSLTQRMLLYSHLVDALGNQEQYDEAFEEISNVLDNAETPPMWVSAFRERKVRLLRECGQPEEALLEIDEMLSALGESSNRGLSLKLQRIDALKDLNRLDEALAQVNELIIESDSLLQSTLLLKRAEVYEALGNADAAVQDRETAQELMPNYDLDEFWPDESMSTVSEYFHRGWFFRNVTTERIGLLWLAIWAWGMFVANRQRREGNGTFNRQALIVALLSASACMPLLIVWIGAKSYIINSYANTISFAVLSCGYLVWHMRQILLPTVRWISGSNALPEAAPEVVSRVHEICAAMGIPNLTTRLLPSMNLEADAYAGGLIAPSVVVGDGILHRLKPNERDAILAHEVAHIANGSLWWYALLPVASTLVAVVVAMFSSEYFSVLWGLTFVYGVRKLMTRYFEFDSDYRAATAVGFEETISALAKIHAVSSMENTGIWSQLVYATSTHPSRDERLSSLAAQSPQPLHEELQTWDESTVRRTRFIWQLSTVLWLALLGLHFLPLSPAIRTFYSWALIAPFWLPMLYRHRATKTEYKEAGTKRSSQFWSFTMLGIGIFVFAQYFDDPRMFSVPSLFLVAAAVVIRFFGEKFHRNVGAEISQLMTQRQFKEAVELAEKHERKIARDFNSRYNVAVAKFLLGKDVEAIDELEELRDRFPANDLAWQILISIYFELNYISQARIILEEESKHADSLTWICNMFFVCTREHKLDAAEPYLKLIREQIPDSATRYVAESSMALERKEQDEAWRFVKIADELAPGEVGITSFKARLAFELGPQEDVPHLLAEAEALSNANPFSLCQRRLARLRAKWELKQSGNDNPTDDSQGIEPAEDDYI
ncbi:MAG: M48 family metalloprotease [Planctomycetaceae bacterium]|nr:M48 family metalloprotease [Planctomycetaceae bacterium]